MRLPLAAAALVVLVAAATSTTRATVIINEVDYDQPGTDTAEFIELAGTAGTNLSAWSIELVNGNDNTVYGTYPLPNFTFANETGTGWGFFVLGRPSVPNNDMDLGADASVQNGSPDGIRLLLSGNPVHYVSYEPISAMPGANDIVPTGTLDDNTTPDSSIYKTGTGADYPDFTWAFGNATPGVLNPGQTLIPEPTSLAACALAAFPLVGRRRR